MLGDSYNYFHGNSMTSTEIIRKNVVMNGLRSGLESFSAQNGDTAGLVNTATQTSMAKMRLSQATSASIAANTLPVMHSVLLGMTMALFPVLIVLAVVSSCPDHYQRLYLHHCLSADVADSVLHTEPCDELLPAGKTQRHAGDAGHL